MRKKSEEPENYTQALGELKCAYTKKKWLFYFRKGTAVLIFEDGALWTIYGLDSIWRFYYIRGHLVLHLRAPLHLWPIFITFEGFITFVASTV